MITTILIVSLFFLLGLGFGAVIIWFVFRFKKAAKNKELIKKTALADALAFRWKHIIMPVAILFLSIVLAAYFYHLLPAEVAYRFNSDGSPNRWLSREMTVVLMLAPQFLLGLVAGAIAWGITKLSRLFRQTESVLIKPEGIILLMGNMIALPQIVLGFVMLDIFSYNVYGEHLIPIWLFAIIIMALGGIIIGVLFIQAIQRTGVISR